MGFGEAWDNKDRSTQEAEEEPGTAHRSSVIKVSR